jgi:hypothetical protein
LFGGEAGRAAHLSSLTITRHVTEHPHGPIPKLMASSSPTPANCSCTGEHAVVHEVGGRVGVFSVYSFAKATLQ